jgi:nicotinamide mononucleotide (NMN) deamidase PncC
MDKTEIVVGILENVDFAARHCHLCPSEAITEMVEASAEIDKVVSALSGTPHAAPPGGEGGSPAARFYLVSAKEKVQSFQFFNIGSRELDVLDGVRHATHELRRGLEDAASPRL